MLQFTEPPVEIRMQHYAFLVDDELFDRTCSRLLEWGIPDWADPRMSRPGETNAEDGGRGCIEGPLWARCRTHHPALLLRRPLRGGTAQAPAHVPVAVHEVSGTGEPAGAPGGRSCQG